MYSLHAPFLSAIDELWQHYLKSLKTVTGNFRVFNWRCVDTARLKSIADKQISNFTFLEIVLEIREKSLVWKPSTKQLWAKRHMQTYPVLTTVPNYERSFPIIPFNGIKTPIKANSSCWKINRDGNFLIIFGISTWQNVVIWMSSGANFYKNTMMD